MEFFIDTIFPVAHVPPKEMSTRNISWGIKAADALG
jgi:hypothetical protein